MTPGKRKAIQKRLEALPLRAIVAFAARCARRVQPFYRRVDLSRVRAVDEAIGLAELFAGGKALTSEQLRAAAAAAYADAAAAAAAADAAAYAADADAAAYAADAADADADAAAAAAAAAAYADAAAAAAAANADNADNADKVAAVERAIEHDLAVLESANLGASGTRGKPVSVSERSRLGPLWPDGPPKAYLKAKRELDDLLAGNTARKQRDSSADEALSQLQRERRKYQEKAASAQERAKRLDAELTEQQSEATKLQSERESLSADLKRSQQQLEQVKKARERLSFGGLLAQVRERAFSIDAWVPLSILSLTFAVLLFLVGTVLTATSEIVGRQQLSSTITKWTSDAESRYIALNGSEADNADEKTRLTKQLDVAAKLKLRTRLLTATGAHYESDRLPAIREDFQRQVLDNDTANGPAQPAGAADVESFGRFTSLFFTSRWKNDLLLSVVVILSGAIGAVVTTLRTAAAKNGVGSFEPWALLLGAATGFIALLAIRSGKSVFIVEMQEASVIFNPYTSAAAGFLAGAFTEKAFDLLISVVNKFVRVTKEKFELGEYDKGEQPAAVDSVSSDR